MARLSLFNSPLLLGFEPFEEALERISKASADGYPPYNVAQLDQDRLRITLAVAGFAPEDLEVQVQDNQLVIRGRQNEDKTTVYLHRGIAARQFQRSFVLADGIEVTNATMDNGLLHLDLERPVSTPRVRTIEIATASPRITGCLVASEDMAADLGAERGPDGVELAYVRARFHVECTAAGVPSIDCPYTWTDAEGAEIEARTARRLGYRAKSTVIAEHAAIINRVFTPSEEEIARARRIVDAFEQARASGEGRVEVDGSLVEVPIYLNATRLLARARELGIT